MTLTEIHQKIQYAKALDFGTIFNQSIELFKKVWLQGLIMRILNMALLIPFAIIMYIPMVILGISGALDSEAIDQMEPIAIIIFGFLYLLFITAAIVISFGLLASIYRIVKNKDEGSVASDDYFFFFKKAYLKKTISMALIYGLIAIVSILLCVLPIIYTIVPLTYIAIIYAFNPELSNSEIVKLAFNLGNKKWLLTFGLLFVSVVLAYIVGILLCLIGVYVTMFFVQLPPYQIYKEVIGFKTDDELQQIGNSKA